MEKIKSLFQRNYEGDRLVTPEIVPGSEWVLNGEGVATRKWDGTACMVKDGVLYKRYDAKKGKTPPDGFIPAQEPDEVTGHWPGWVKVGEGKEDKWFWDAKNLLHVLNLPNATYELVGSKINGDPEKLGFHTLIAHGKEILNAPRTYEELKEWFKDKDIEGIVWHHPDGRMVKIKKRDFGYKREVNYNKEHA